MDPKIYAMLTVFVVGILAFFIGLLLTSSKWKRKHVTVKKDNDLLKTQITNLNNRIAKLEKDEKNASELYFSAQTENKDLEEDRDRLKTNNIAIERQLRNLKAKHNPEEINRLTQEVEKERNKRVQLEADYNKLKSNQLTNKTADKLAVPTDKNNGAQTAPSLTYKLTTIFNRIGLRDPKHEDDLTQINGIGQDISTKLNKIGVYNYKQLAQLKQDDLNVIDEALEFFPGRALRDKWIEQAKWLYEKKYS